MTYELTKEMIPWRYGAGYYTHTHTHTHTHALPVQVVSPIIIVYTL